jgi:hypothetical protein
MSNYPPGHPTGYVLTEETLQCPICKVRWNAPGYDDRAVNAWNAVDEDGAFICPVNPEHGNQEGGEPQFVEYDSSLMTPFYKGYMEQFEKLDYPGEEDG